MRATVLLLTALLLTAFAVPSPAAEPTIDQLVQKLAENRKAQDEARKAGESILSDLRAAIDVLNKKLADLGVGPVMPPDPKPLPPDPADPLSTAIRVAYDADAGPKKAEQAKVLSELYRQAADLANDPNVTTAAQLMNRLRSAAGALSITGLEAVRKLIAAECAAQLGTDPDAAITADTRAKAKALFLRIHTILKGLS